jgi:hypothetical protein
MLLGRGDLQHTINTKFFMQIYIHKETFDFKEKK